MKTFELDMILECLGGQRRTFHYFKDKYCLDLIGNELQELPGQAMSLRDLRQGRWEKFLHKPLLKSILADCGDGMLRSEQLKAAWIPEQYAFNLTLGTWYREYRCCQQTARPGGSLVLQLNFDQRHNRAYEKLLNFSALSKYARSNFDAKASVRGFSGHPVNFVRGCTMSWVRMDMDLDRGECLIEEVQNDWLRNSEWLATHFEKCLAKNKVKAIERISPQFKGHYREFIDYVRNVLKPYRTLWAEASLAAAIDFVRAEIGSVDIFYHTADTGARLKGIKDDLPPKSLYTRLPERFGFQLTDEAPSFLQSDKFTRRCMKAIKEPVRFYRL
ncbi:hypothetical protein [Microbulbifer hydrolyticus]|uniref:Uncharacterized protein n=1 Tax=Microbulbifer hydrolyticus TaxID=48074 RepID=A0A6P1TAN3_9GAMM|nr:hypothetical protein [Microbulbifer hydrolyticus]MBB5210877.1 hypothetical protein [Microbulbifer hydrolyticus]QHQ38696.1 hypothetical protein GTQ55_06635 [Microbulbifer hydrolyticus]